MKAATWSFLIAALAFGLTAGSSVAQVEGRTQTIQGEVVDLACYIGHNGIGAGHQQCAQKCISGGLPVGIRTQDGHLYLAVGAEHGSANSDLAPLAARQVLVEGGVAERDGVRLIVIKKVTLLR